jgi:hypothetical protein
VLATEVSVIELNEARQLVLALAPSHGVTDLVLQGPGGGVAHAELTLERQRGQAGLGLADQVDGQEPGAQRQLGVLEQAAGGQRRLVSAGLALEELAGAVAHDPVAGRVAAGATKAAGPARRLERLLALRFGVETGHELRQRYALLELDAVERHDPISVLGWGSGYRSGRSPGELHEARY